MNHKRMMQRLSGFIAAFTIVCCFFSFCSLEAAAEDKKVVRIACGIDSFLYADENGNLNGHCSEYLRRLARINNWQLEYVDAGWTEAVDMLEKGEIDILFPTDYMPEREETMEFSRLMGGYNISGLFVEGDSDYNYEDYTGFNGASIAVTQGSSNEMILKELSEKKGFDYTPVYLNSVSEKTEALEKGGADMVIFSSSNNISGLRLVSILDAEPFYYTVKKGNSELLSELNSGMEQLLMGEPDVVADTFSGCIESVNKARLAFTAQEREFIADGREIRVGFYSETEPLAYIDSDGNYDGIYVRLLQKAKEISGANIILYPISREEENWQELIENGTIDFYIGASCKILSSDSGYICTNTFMDYETTLITKKSYVMPKNGIQGSRLALTNARSYWVDNNPEKFNGVDIIYCETAKDCLLAVKNGRADMTMLNTVEYNYQSKNSRFSDLIQRENYKFQAGTAMAAASDADSLMLSVIDKAMNSLSDEEIEGIINNYLNMPYETMEFADYVYSGRYMLILGGFILALLLTVFLILHIIRRKQREQDRIRQKHEKHQMRILEETNENLRQQMDIVGSLSSIYFTTFTGDLVNGTIKEVEIPVYARAMIEESDGELKKALEIMADRFVSAESADTVRKFVDFSTLSERIGDRPVISCEYLDIHNGWRRFNIIPMERDTDGRVLKAVFTVQLIDEEKKKELETQNALQSAFESANQANHAKSDFLSKMSHDMRTPMNAIIGMTAIAGAHIDDRERVADCLNKITSSSRHLLGLINEVLDMNKIESGIISLAEEEFNLPEMLNNTLTILQPELRQHRHQFDVYINNISHEDVIGDSLRIQQIVLNIMGNAIKYTPDGGRICLYVSERPARERMLGCYEFIFEDNGFGMSEEYIQHMFEPFSRADDARINKIQGTGLGMTITHNIIHMMNGDIRVESEMGKGSRFTVTIFLKLPDKREDISTEELVGLPVLVADDDIIACESTCEMLNEIGMDSEWVLSGMEAVKRVEATHREANDFYAVILDWQMPEMDGVETARAIKRIVGDEVPVIILSAYDWSDIEAEAREAGVIDFLSKPVFQSSLIRLFKRLKRNDSSHSGQVSAASSPAEEIHRLSECDFSAYTVLLVEDNELNREIASEFLKMTGIHVEEAEDGKKALDMFAASPQGYYSMIFMDIQMPVMNGYESTSAIRALDREDAAKVAIVAMTANAFTEDIQAAKRAGMNEHLAKPIDLNALMEVFRKYLQ